MINAKSDHFLKYFHKQKKNLILFRPHEMVTFGPSQHLAALSQCLFLNSNFPFSGRIGWKKAKNSNLQPLLKLMPSPSASSKLGLFAKIICK